MLNLRGIYARLTHADPFLEDMPPDLTLHLAHQQQQHDHPSAGSASFSQLVRPPPPAPPPLASSHGTSSDTSTPDPEGAVKDVHAVQTGWDEIELGRIAGSRDGTGIEEVRRSRSLSK